jgi:hypothetical protein
MELEIGIRSLDMREEKIVPCMHLLPDFNSERAYQTQIQPSFLLSMIGHEV